MIFSKKNIFPQTSLHAKILFDCNNDYKVEGPVPKQIDEKPLFKTWDQALW